MAGEDEEKAEAHYGRVRQVLLDRPDGHDPPAGQSHLRACTTGGAVLCQQRLLLLLLLIPGSLHLHLLPLLVLPLHLLLLLFLLLKCSKPPKAPALQEPRGP